MPAGRNTWAPEIILCQYQPMNNEHSYGHNLQMTAYHLKQDCTAQLTAAIQPRNSTRIFLSTINTFLFPFGLRYSVSPNVVAVTWKLSLCSSQWYRDFSAWLFTSNERRINRHQKLDLPADPFLIFPATSVKENWDTNRK